jgi:diguanylate cyclase (GGDEF)-like protein
MGATAILLVACAVAGFSWLKDRELRRGQAELRGLVAMGSRIEGAREADAIAVTLCDAVVRTFGFRRGAVALGVEGGSAGAAIAAHGPALVRRLDPVADRELDERLPGARNVVVVPLVADAQALGVLALEWPADRISGRTLAMVGQYAAHAGLALRNAQLVAEVERLATTDSLTGLANRRVLEETLLRETGRAERSGAPLSVLVVDADHFKAVNDTYGHQTGDDVLRHVAAVLRRESRAGDLAARYGGEEFVVVLPECSLEEALAAAERLRRAMPEGAPVAFTVSIGVATAPQHAADAEGLVARADAALYRAKRGGRNRVVAAGGRVRTPARAVAV